MGWNKKIFVDNIDYLVKKHCDGVQSRFEDRIEKRDAVYKWTKTDTSPSLASILKIQEVFNCDIDWLLTGRQASNSAPEWTFNPKVRDRYGFLQKVVSEANEGAKEDTTDVAMCGIIKGLMNNQLIKLKDKLI